MMTTQTPLEAACTGAADERCRFWVGAQFLEIFALREVCLLARPVAGEVQPIALDVDNSQRIDLRQSRHLFLEEDVMFAIGKLAWIAT